MTTFKIQQFCKSHLRQNPPSILVKLQGGMFPIQTVCYLYRHLTFHINTIQYNIIQYNTIQYNTIQYNTIQYNTIQYNMIKFNTIQYNTIQYNTTQHNTTQHNTIQYNTIQYNTIQYNTIQYNIIKFNTIRYNTIQYNTTQNNTTQHNTIQYNTIQYNTTQHTNKAFLEMTVSSHQISNDQVLISFEIMQIKNHIHGYSPLKFSIQNGSCDRWLFTVLEDILTPVFLSALTSLLNLAPMLGQAFLTKNNLITLHFCSVSEALIHSKSYIYL